MEGLGFNRKLQMQRMGKVYRGISLAEKREIGRTGQFLRLREAERVSDPAQTAALERRVLSMRGMEVSRQGWTPADLGPAALVQMPDRQINVVALQMLSQVQEILSLSCIFSHADSGFEAKKYRNVNGFVVGVADPETQEQIAQKLKELTSMDVRLLFPAEARKLLEDPGLAGFRQELVEDAIGSLYTLADPNPIISGCRLNGFFGGGLIYFKDKPNIVKPEKLGLFLGIPA